jgi:hypothetical protein
MSMRALTFSSNGGECRNPSFEPRQRGLQGCEPRGSPKVMSHAFGSVGKCEGMNLHIPKATPTLGDGVPMDSKIFRRRLQGSKLNALISSLYH